MTGNGNAGPGTDAPPDAGGGESGDGGLGARLPSLGPRGEGWVAIQVVLFVVLAWAGVAVLGAPDWGAPFLVPGRLLGGLLVLVGATFAALGLAGLRENLTPNPMPRAGGRLIDSGIYGIVRHPIYTGVIAGAFGWALICASLPALLVASLLGVFFDTKARREEAWLRAAYPGYAAYARRVRKLVPFLY